MQQDSNILQIDNLSKYFGGLAAVSDCSLKIKKGSKEPGRDIIKTISQSQCKEIAEKKLNDLNANTVDQGMKIVMGSARSMGIEVTN